MEPLADGGPHRRPLWPGFAEGDPANAPVQPGDEEQDRKALYEELRQVPREQRPRPYNNRDPIELNSSLQWFIACCIWRWPVRSLLPLLGLLAFPFAILPGASSDPVFVAFAVVVIPGLMWGWPLYVMRRWIAAGVPIEPRSKRWRFSGRG